MLVRPLLALPLLFLGTHPAARIATGQNPCGATATAKAVWVANDGSGTLARVDPSTNRVTRRIPVGKGACEVASGFGALWVTNYNTGAIVRVDLQTYRRQRIKVGNTPFDVVVAAGRVWTTTWGDGDLVEIEPAKGRVLRRVAVGAYPTGLLFRGGSLWVGFGREATHVARVDPTSGQVTRFSVGVKAPSHFVSTAHGIWVVNDGDALVHLDATTGAVLGTTHVGRTLVQPAVARDGMMWVPDKEIDTIFRIDPSDGRLVGSFAGGDGAFTALRAFGAMWVTSYAGADLWRFRG